jgi:tetratricopeptide (TPR) repeat protein
MASSFPPFSSSPQSQQRVQQLMQRATTLQQAGRFGEAIPALEELARIQPKNIGVLKALATCLTAVERLPAARERIDQGLAIEPRDAKLYHILAYTWKREASWENALAAIDKAIRFEPNQPAFKASKAEILHFAGRTEEAMQTIEPLLGVASSVPTIAAVFATIAPRVKRQADAIPIMEAVLARTDLAGNSRIKYCFDLASLYDSVGNADAAWTRFEEGNRLKTERWDPSRHRYGVDAVIAAWTRESLTALPRSPVDGSPFVFIVGMPRSGTSLVEQIVSTAPSVHAAGERTELLRVAAQVAGRSGGSLGQGIPFLESPAALGDPDALKKAADGYALPIRALAPSAGLITDKMPPNFLNLGMVQALLPGAKVIHCRRNAMDSCLSCYFQLFGGALSFAYNLDHCGRFYVDYERLMAHWNQVLDLPILDVPYESLVADQENWTRTIFEFLGLTYSDAALRFHESERTTLTASNQQVREPIHSRSVARWKRYSNYLDPLRKALGSYAES